jgi:serine/threonine protein kinase
MSLPRLRRRYRISEAPNEPSIQSSAARDPEVIDIASFLTFIIQADIHLFGQSFHSREHPSPAGAGATYAVSQSTLNFEDLGFRETDTYDDGAPMRGGEVSKGDILVTKRVGVSRDETEQKTLSYANVIRPVVQELRVLSHPPLREHPNIIDLFGVAWEEKPDWAGYCWPVVVLEYAGCGNLIDFFTLRDFDVSWAMKLQLALNVVEALGALHQCGIIHGDLKAENVLVMRDSDGTFRAKLCDFGFAIIKADYRDEVTQVPIWGFTPRWAAPELRHGNLSLDLAETADTYSLGLLFALILQDGKSPHLIDVSWRTLIF